MRILEGKHQVLRYLTPHRSNNGRPTGGGIVPGHGYWVSIDKLQACLIQKLRTGINSHTDLSNSTRTTDATFVACHVAPEPGPESVRWIIRPGKMLPSVDCRGCEMMEDRISLDSDGSEVSPNRVSKSLIWPFIAHQKQLHNQVIFVILTILKRKPRS